MTQWYDMFLRGEYQATVFMDSRERLADFTRRYSESYSEETGEREPYPEEIRYVQRSSFNGEYLTTLDSQGGYISSYPPVESVSRGPGDTFAADSEGGEV